MAIEARTATAADMSALAHTACAFPVKSVSIGQYDSNGNFTGWRNSIYSIYITAAANPYVPEPDTKAPLTLSNVAAHRNSK